MKNILTTNWLIDWLWGIAITLALAFTYAWVQNADDAAHKLELARAKQQGYNAGYNTGSSAGLIAAHKSCKEYLHLNHCDQVLAAAQVLASDEVQ